VALTDEGFDKAARLLGSDPVSGISRHRMEAIHVEQALKAHVLFHLDKDYVVKDGGSSSSWDGSPAPDAGRRWSDGLHQAVEAKEAEGFQRRETQTLATINTIHDTISACTKKARRHDGNRRDRSRRVR